MEQKLVCIATTDISIQWDIQKLRCARHREKPRRAFAPSLPLISVPSRSRSARSIPRWSSTLIPINSAQSHHVRVRLLFTPLPCQVEPPSRSTASCSRVLAPLGTQTTQNTFFCLNGDFCRVPRESRIEGLDRGNMTSLFIDIKILL